MNGWFIFLTTLSPLLAEVPSHDFSSDLSSDHASYSKDVFVLKGNVTLNHHLGEISAEIATLNKGGPLLEFSSVLLQNEVSIFFKPQGTLFADQTFFDFKTLKGEALSTTRPVVYKGNDLDISCRKMNLSLTQIEKVFEVAHLTAKEEVQIDYLTDFHIACEKAFYESNGLTATGETLSTLTYLGDRVDAKNIHLDLITNLFSLESPKGKLASLFFPDDPDRTCQFASHILTWDHQNKHLLLEKGVVIHDPTLGTLIGEGTFSLKQTNRFGKRITESIETKGKTILSSNTGESLTSYGTLALDQEKCFITCSNPSDKQLKYENQELLLLADKGRIEYATEENGQTLQMVYLDGNVQLFSCDLSRRLRRGLADRVVHNPISMETRLFSDGENSVLFWDKEKKLRLSAPEILIAKKGEKEVIKGIGTVRFAFTHEESKRINKLLPERM